MKFRGLIVTDAMDMGGVTSLYPPGEAAVRSVEAGADVLLMPPLPDAAMAGLENAVSSGRISVKRIDESVRRILGAKARIGLDKQRLRRRSAPQRKVRPARLRCWTRSASPTAASRFCATLPKLLPLDSTRPLRVLLVALSADPDPFPAETLEPEIRPRVDSLTVLRADTQFRSVSTLKLPNPNAYDVAIAALFVRVADRKGNVGFPDDQRAFIESTARRGKAHRGRRLRQPVSHRAVSQRANVARRIFDQRRLPARRRPRAVWTDRHRRANPGHRSRNRENRRWHASRGKSDDPSARALPRCLHRLKPAYDLLDRAVADGAFPGGVLAVGWNNELAVHPFGKLTRDPKSPAVTADTIYDVASLTKPIVTTTAIMSLVQRGELDLDAPVGRFLPEWAKAAKSDPDPAWRARVTVRMLLLHDSGLPAHRDFFKDAKGHDAVLAQASWPSRSSANPARKSNTPISASSCLAKSSSASPAIRWTKRRKDIFAPLRMNDSLFNPPKNLRSQIAPTEDDTSYRKRLMQGEVDDENAWAMGGVAGHAGLFSTAGDIAAFAQMLLNGGIYAHHRMLRRATIQQFTARHSDRRFRARSRLGRSCASPPLPASISPQKASATPASPALRCGSTRSATCSSFCSPIA